MKRARNPRSAAQHSPQIESPRKWVVRFDMTGLAARDVRMLEEMIEGNLRMARLAFGGGAASEAEERRIAERIRDMVAVDFPEIAFRVEAS